VIAVLDTNVVISGILSAHGPPGRLLDLVVADRLALAFDDRILHEYRSVLARPRLGIEPGVAAAVLTAIERTGRPVAAPPIALELPDPSDLPFVEVAVAAGPVPLVTGNARHFAGAASLCDVLNPREALGRFR
jgi:uncharacterized protein